MADNKSANRTLWQMIKRFFKKEPESPEDPHAYVGAPKKPRLPGRSAAAVADLPDE